MVFKALILLVESPVTGWAGLLGPLFEGTFAGKAVSTKACGRFGFACSLTGAVAKCFDDGLVD